MKIKIKRICYFCFKPRFSLGDRLNEFCSKPFAQHFSLTTNNNYLCTYDLYRPVHNVLDACISIMWGSGRGLGPGIPEFFGPCEMETS
jgi:hypothetical protein